MAQAGMHGLVGLAAQKLAVQKLAVQKVAPQRPWLMLGVVLGSLLPDADNFAVAIATLAGRPTEGLHRTFSHSFFMVLAVILVFYLVGRVANRPRWGNFGLGLGVASVMHILFDLLIWFDGVQLLWPLPLQVNLWQNTTPADWWMKLMMPAEFVLFALFFAALREVAGRQGTDMAYRGWLLRWAAVELVLFAVFTVLVYSLAAGFLTIYGAVYLLSLLLALGVTIRMRQTIEG